MITMKTNLKSQMKGQMTIDAIGGTALSIGVAIITVAVIAMVLGNMATNVTDKNATYVIGKGLTAIASFSDWFSIIVIVVIAVIILALVLMLRGRPGSTA